MGTGNLLMVHEVTSTPHDHVLVQEGTTTARWDFVDGWGDPLGPHVDVGLLRWVIGDLTDGVARLWDELDAIGGDEVAMDSVLLQMETKGDLLGVDCVLLVMHAEVPREARGAGLGLLMAQEFTRFTALGRSEPSLVVYPQPNGWQEMQADDVSLAQGRLREHWQLLGFEPIVEASGPC